MNSQRINVVFVDDSEDIARLYARMMHMEGDMECLETLCDADHIVEVATQLRPHVVVMDLTMPGRDPLQAIADLKRTCPDVRTIAFSGHDDPATIDAAIAAGAAATASKHGDPRALLAIIRTVAANAPTPAR